MAVSIMQLPTDINQEKLSLKMGGDGEPESLEMEGKVFPLNLSRVQLPESHQQELGKWAVEEHNRRTGEKLVLVCVHGGWKAKVTDMILYNDLHVVAKDHGVPKKYGAVVLDCPDSIIYFRILLLFREVIKN